METWKRIPLYLVAVTYLLLGAAASNEQYQMFLNKHHDNPTTKIENSGYCDILMNYRKLIQSCVPMNIFIHASETQLQDVCGDGGVPYHGTGNRQSRQSYPVTICRLGVVTRTRRCIYYATYSNMRLFLSCDENNLPVLLDEVLTLGS
uniref:angiogenin-like n=1 Tax=Euleptes europaea TaxID=460621 RepID=UPI0025412A89|nr:angiogenin-like [Euleptes europaea]